MMGICSVRESKAQGADPLAIHRVDCLTAQCAGSPSLCSVLRLRRCPAARAIEETTQRYIQAHASRSSEGTMPAGTTCAVVVEVKKEPEICPVRVLRILSISTRRD